MKKLLFLFIVLVFIAEALPVRAELYDSSLIGWWRMDTQDISGATLTDRSKANNTGVLQSLPTPITGQLGQALSFDGFSQYISTTNVVNIPHVTIAAWINLASVPFDSAVITGFEDTFGGGATDKNFYVDQNQKIGFYAYDGNICVTPAPATTIPIGKWVFVTATADGTNAKAYVNGVLQGSVPCGDTYTGYAFPNIFIGAEAVSSFGSFPGSIDDVRVYNRALSTSEIQQLYYQGLHTYGAY